MVSKITTPRIIIALGLAVLGIGLRHDRPSPRYSDAELELAERHAEDETLPALPPRSTPISPTRRAPSPASARRANSRAAAAPGRGRPPLDS